MSSTSAKSSVRSLVLFSVFVLLLGWVGRWLDSMLTSPAGDQPGMLLWLLAPMIVSFLIRGIAKEGWRDLGWKPVVQDKGKSWVIGLLVFPVAILIVLLIGTICGVVDFRSGNGGISLFFRLAAISLLPQLVQNIFEESGFRGYMTPKLLALGVDPMRAHLITGLVWGLWHLPYMAAIMPYTNEMLWTLAPRFVLGTMVLSLIFGELKRRSGSIWPVIVAQTIGGVALTGLLTSNLIHVARQGQLWFMPTVEGAGMILLFAAFGFMMLRRVEKQS